MQSLNSVLINRNYARLWYGQAISTVGDFAFDTTLVLWMATVLGRGKPWAPIAVSGVMITAGAAVFVIGPLAGVFVDRWDRRRTMLGTEVVRGILVALLTVVSFAPVGSLPVWIWLGAIYLVVFTVNSAGQFFSPARFATLGQIVPGDVDRARAAGIGQATQATAAIIGPPLAAPLLLNFGLHWALLFNALTYAVSFIAIRSVRLAPAESQDNGQDQAERQRSSLRADFVAGLRFFASSRFLVALLSVAVICQVGTGALTVLDVFFTTKNLHANPHLYGLLGTALGGGAIVGALSTGRAVKWLGSRATICLSMIVGGALIVIFSRQTVFVAALAVLFAIAIPVTLVNTAMSPLILAAAPSQYIGRVLAVFTPLNQLASMVSMAIAGWLAGSALRHFSASLAGLHLGPIDTIFAASGLLVLIAGVYGFTALPRPATAPPAASPTAQPL